MFVIPIRRNDVGLNNFFLNRYIYVYDNSDLVSDRAQNKHLLYVIDTYHYKLILRFIEINEKTYSFRDNRLCRLQLSYAGPRASIASGFKVKIRFKSFELKFTMYTNCNICQFWCKSLTKKNTYFKHVEDYYFLMKDSLDTSELAAYYTETTPTYVTTTIV